MYTPRYRISLTHGILIPVEEHRLAHFSPKIMYLLANRKIYKLVCNNYMVLICGLFYIILVYTLVLSIEKYRCFCSFFSRFMVGSLE